MFDSQQRSTGIGYTMTVALLTVAFVFIPAALVVTLCVGLAWISWKKLSRLTISSITSPDARTK
jgi:hypothetical protein